ncbi:hypothetical protein [Flavobacterium tegetincola]|uniref:hypothetical protein n=1 Tax=Flavobacterium tegetincola TaxID=150172 RepID=UPI00040B6C8B|nr:hypothetical protein [Flavobacterium tegetincola]
MPFLDFRGCHVVDVYMDLWMKAKWSAENAVASSKNNAGTSELVCGYEILKVVKVVGLQMIVVGIR